MLEKFDFPNTIAKLEEHGLLFMVMEKFASSVVDLLPDKVSNHEMGYIFEELVRRFNEALDENPGEHCRIFDSTEFGYRRITVERPLRLNFHVTPERLARLQQESGFHNLAASKKKEPKAKAAEEAEGRKLQAAIVKALGALPQTICKSREHWLPKLDDALKRAAPLGERES